MRKFFALLAAVLVVLTAAGCSTEADDAAMAAKYQAAVSALPHVVRVEASYRTNVGMGRTASLVLHADTDDETELKAVLAAAFPAVVKAAEGDPNVSLPLQVVPASGGDTVGPESLGYTGTGTLESYREFLAAHPALRR